MQLTRAQVNAMTLGERPALRRDLCTHLQSVHPRLFDIHPLPYLVALVDDSISLALQFGFNDVQAMRVFLQLRWDVAPGYYLEPTLAAALDRHAHEGMACWSRLAHDRYGDAWLAAHQYKRPEHWRQRLWDPSVHEGIKAGASQTSGHKDR